MNLYEPVKKGVFLYHDLFEAFEWMTDEQLGKTVRMLLDYSRTGVIPDGNDDTVVNVAFDFLKKWDDISRARYEKIIEKRRKAGIKGAQARWNGGAKGAAS